MDSTLCKQLLQITLKLSVIKIVNTLNVHYLTFKLVAVYGSITCLKSISSWSTHFPTSPLCMTKLWGILLISASVGSWWVFLFFYRVQMRRNANYKTQTTNLNNAWMGEYFTESLSHISKMVTDWNNLRTLFPFPILEIIS